MYHPTCSRLGSDAPGESDVYADGSKDGFVISFLLFWTYYNGFSTYAIDDSLTFDYNIRESRGGK
jgi:hypothetical protein